MSAASLMICLSFFFTACKKDINDQSLTGVQSENAVAENSLLKRAHVTQASPLIIYTNADCYNVYNGGYGSAIATAPGQGSDAFYLMTDRGSNVNGPVSDSKTFILPSFSPQIALFKIIGDSAVKQSRDNLKRWARKSSYRLPNPGGASSSGETAYDLNGNLLAADPNGLDAEGLVAMKDGSFWVSDEYGPHIVHFNSTGVTLGRISPFDNGSGGRQIPAVFALRRANRGMEGLTLTKNGGYLVGMMQSPLDNPKSVARSTRTVRILFFNLATGKTKQFLYQMESKDNVISDILAIGNKEFLVLERDGNFPLVGQFTSSFKKVYRINVTGATDVSDSTNSAKGALYSDKTIEELADDLASVGIIPVRKFLALDIIAAAPDYAHDKAEGITLTDEGVLAVSNDDDFGIIDGASGGTYIPKYLPFYDPQQVVDRGEIYFLKLK